VNRKATNIPFLKKFVPSIQARQKPGNFHFPPKKKQCFGGKKSNVDPSAHLNALTIDPFGILGTQKRHHRTNVIGISANAQFSEKVFLNTPIGISVQPSWIYILLLTGQDKNQTLRLVK